MRQPSEPIDLFMVEIIAMQHKTDMESKLVKGLVLRPWSSHLNAQKQWRMLSSSLAMFLSNMKKGKYLFHIRKPEF